MDGGLRWSRRSYLLILVLQEKQIDILVAGSNSIRSHSSLARSEEVWHRQLQL
uniref:Uncharacterized protein n=1 Tax=Arundo donax TaxID=35708 RepID=A0A0A9DZW6_ARUDO